MKKENCYSEKTSENLVEGPMDINEAVDLLEFVDNIDANEETKSTIMDAYLGKNLSKPFYNMEDLMRELNL